MKNEKGVIELFQDLTRIDSPSGAEQKLAEYIIRRLKRIKIKAWRDHYGNVIARVPGSGTPLLLNAHLDTLGSTGQVKPIMSGGLIRSDGNGVLGADDKAGITGILAALQICQENKIKTRPLELIFTREEEDGLKGALNLNYGRIRAKQGFIFDYDLPLGTIITAEPCVYLVDIKITGRTAHAGEGPEKGINALSIAVKAIVELPVGRLNRQTAVNIGTISGGSSTNSVPGEIRIKAEVRSFSLAEAQRQVDLIGKIFKKHVRRFGAKILAQTRLACYGYEHNPDDKFIKEVAAVNRAQGLKVSYKNSWQESDANVFNRKKIKTILLACGGQNSHTKAESIRISELAELTQQIITLVKIK